MAASLAAILCAVPPQAGATARADIAALQVALRAHRIYAGPIDGVAGSVTVSAVRKLQRRAALPADGIAGPRTRSALGRHGRPALGRRTISLGDSGWDVAMLQFLLARRGFPSGDFDGGYGPRTAAAVRRFQRSVGLPPVGWVGARTRAALRSRAPHTHTRLARPAGAALSGLFGPRDTRFHAGVDFAEGMGAPVLAAARGRIAYAGWHPGGFGFLVAIAHGDGLRTLYAHLSQVSVSVGQRVRVGTEVGHVGSSGRSSGPHLHFETRLRGGAIDPLPILAG